jgi:hypothetical protein
VDTIVNLKNPEGNKQGSPNQRVLEAVSRFDEIPGSVLIERTIPDSDQGVPMGSEFDPNQYRRLGEPRAVAAERAAQAVLMTLPAHPPGLSVDELREQLRDIAPPTLKRGVDALVESGQVVTTGSGKRGNAFKYYLSGLGPAVEI